MDYNSENRETVDQGFNVLLERMPKVGMSPSPRSADLLWHFVSRAIERDGCGYYGTRSRFPHFDPLRKARQLHPQSALEETAIAILLCTLYLRGHLRPWQNVYNQ
jgi:hypothetical protein